MKIDILTIFPEFCLPYAKGSLIGKAVENGILDIRVHDIRANTQDRHNRTDDTPFGGGAGMIMTPQPIFDTIKNIDSENPRYIYMSPRGKKLTGDFAVELSKENEIVILCGRYEGVDGRVLEHFDFEEVSIGDYVLTGGELPALVLLDAAVRFMPGVVGNENSIQNESIYSGLLEHSQYTKPRTYEGLDVPAVLFGGDHGKINLWKFEESLRITKKNRPDLFEKYLLHHVDLTSLSKKELAVLQRVKQEEYE